MIKKHPITQRKKNKSLIKSNVVSQKKKKKKKKKKTQTVQLEGLQMLKKTLNYTKKEEQVAH